MMCVLFVAALAGCSMAPRDNGGFVAVSEDGTPDRRSAMAELPAGAGKIVAVMQNAAGGVLTQRIVLSGDADTVGENAIVVKVNQSRGPQDIDGPVGPPTRYKIATELDENFAGVEMRLSDSFSRNSFGPFGYAVGHPRAGVTCVYAWQWAVFKPPLIGQASTGAPSLPTDPTSVRVRLCRSTLDEAEIVSLLRSLQVYPLNSRIAYVDPSSAGAVPGGDALAAAGVGYFVVPGAAGTPPVRERLEPARKKHKTAHRRHSRHEHEVAEEDRAVASEAPVRGVAVPMPGGAATAAAVETHNPLLAPLAATAAARVRGRDDMPLPGASRAAHSATAADGLSVPLPN